jgi:hypothetical protein
MKQTAESDHALDGEVDNAFQPNADLLDWRPWGIWIFISSEPDWATANACE